MYSLKPLAILKSYIVESKIYIGILLLQEVDRCGFTESIKKEDGV
jgi:hypothetical protein